MSRLLSANFMRLKKSGIFLECMSFMVGLGVIYPILGYFQNKKGYDVVLDDGFLVCIMFIGIVLSIFCSLFVGTEYSDGTIRNKIMIGHTRVSIYFANLVVCAFVSIALCIAFSIPYFCIGIPLLGFFKTKISYILLFFFCGVILSFAISAIFIFIIMLNQNKAIVSVICLLFAFLSMFAGIYINTKLGEPKTYDAYVYLDESGNTRTKELIQNPNYLSGTKREIYEFLNDFLPGGQAIQIADMSSKHPWKLVLYSSIIMIGVTGAGLFCFQRKDLK